MTGVVTFNSGKDDVDLQRLVYRSRGLILLNVRTRGQFLVPEAESPQK
jgi:hypothetical protein